MKRQLLATLIAGLRGLRGNAAQPAPADAPLRAGASRIDYTPATLPRNIIGVLDPIYVRSIVVDNGRTRAALVTVDAGGISTDLFNKVSARAATGAEHSCHAAACCRRRTRTALPSRPAARWKRTSCRACAMP